MNSKLLTKTLIASAVTFGLSAAVAAPYEIIDLGKVEGGTNSFAYGINNGGEVVGFGNGPLTTDDEGNEVRSFDNHALKFDGSVVDLGTLIDGDVSFALSINDSGVIIGFANQTITTTDDEGNETSEIQTFSTRFDGGTVTKIEELTGMKNTQALSINNDGLVIGIGAVDIDPDDDIGGVNRGYVINALTGEGFMVMPSLTEDSVDRQSTPLSINDLGTIVGWAELDVDESFVRRGFMTTADNPAELVEIPNLDTAVTMATDINNNGVIVGFARRSSGSVKTVGFRYNPATDTELQQLPYFDPNYDNAIANAINDNDQIVGQALVSASTTGLNTGFLYEDSELKDLNNLIACNSGWRIDNATNINNSGEIIGYGLRTEVVDGETINEVRAFKLIPTGGEIEVCETPGDNDDDNGGSFSWLGLSLLALFGLRRKRKN